MLVLTRTVGEEIWLDGGSIRIRVAEIKGSQVRLAIQAPRSISINRREQEDPNHPEYCPPERASKLISNHYPRLSKQEQDQYNADHFSTDDSAP